MFIKRCLAKFKDKEYETFWIVESYIDDNNKIMFHFKDRRVETHIYLCLIDQTVIGYIRRRLKEKGWLSKVKENTLVCFFEKLNSISIGKFNI